MDDDPHITKAIRLRLKTMNVEVLQASDGRAAFQLIKERQPDLVISDWWMERGDGEYLLNRLKNDQDTSHIPIIMMTGVGRPDFMNRMFAQGARSCYTKPLQFDALKEDLCTLLDLDLRAMMKSGNASSARLRRKYERRQERTKNIIRLDSAEIFTAARWSR